MDNLGHLIASTKAKLLADAERASGSAKPKGSKFVEPSSEQWVEHHRRFRPEGYYRIHCSHDKLLIEPCASATCRRGTREAKLNLAKLASGKLW